jgi:hypothetical protein
LHVARQLFRGICALDVNERNEPSHQRRQREKSDDENQNNRLRAAKSAIAQVRHNWVEQIGEDRGDRDRDKNRLKESN